LCTSFAVLAQHYVHTEHASNGGIAIILANLSRPKVHPWEVEKLEGVRKLITIAYAKQHFAVLLFDIPTRQVLVYDGLHMNLIRWEVHIVHTLKKYSLQSIYAEPAVTCHRGSQGKGDEVMEIDFMDDNAPWHVEHDPILKQADGFNCGPIACLKVLEIYGLIEENSIGDIAHQQYGYRGVAMTFYEKFIEKYKQDFQFTIGYSSARKFANVAIFHPNTLGMQGQCAAEYTGLKGEYRHHEEEEEEQEDQEDQDDEQEDQENEDEEEDESARGDKEVEEED